MIRLRSRQGAACRAHDRAGRRSAPAAGGRPCPPLAPRFAGEPARARLARQSGMTLIETLMASVLALVVTTGFFALLDVITHSSANDQERNLSLVEQTSALHRITQELAEAYQLNTPTTAGEYNYVDFNAW